MKIPKDRMLIIIVLSVALSVSMLLTSLWIIGPVKSARLIPQDRSIDPEPIPLNQYDLEYPITLNYSVIYFNIVPTLYSEINEHSFSILYENGTVAYYSPVALCLPVWTFYINSRGSLTWNQQINTQSGETIGNAIVGNYIFSSNFGKFNFTIIPLHF